MTPHEGEKIYRWITDLFPICRSITGNGLRSTLSYLQELLPALTITEVPSGTPVFDWNVPEEWNINDAHISTLDGQRVVDFKKHNLHVVGYSDSVDRIMTFRELDAHLHSLPEQPNAIPYVTSYYHRTWGFCLTDMQRQQLRKTPDEQYRVLIDSDLAPGHMTYGELLIPGQSKHEILLSTYVCHPSMANNELSGPCLAASLAMWIQQKANRRSSYRILFLPETIGSLTYLSRNIGPMKQNIKAGFVLSCVGDERAYSWIESRLGQTLADRVIKHVLDYTAPDHIGYSFLERGSDERQYCAPGIDLPVCGISRSKYGEYSEYHTSLDDLSLISHLGLQQSFDVVTSCIRVLEANHNYTVTSLGEPQLERRQLYPSLSTKEMRTDVRTLMNFIAYCDGDHDLISIAERIGAYAEDLLPTIESLTSTGLIEYAR